MRGARLAFLVLVVVAAAYPVVAFQTPPGFFEGFCPPVDYKFLKPPPQVRATAPPAAGHAAIKALRDSSGTVIVGPGFVATADDNPQAQLSFVPGAFQLPPGGGDEVIDIKPVAQFPAATGITVVTNVYLITSTTPMTKPSNLRLLYSTVLPAPSSIYVAKPDGGGWQAIPSSASTTTGCSDISAQVGSVGYFMAGYPAGSGTNTGGAKVGGGQLLPIIVALAILIVVLAGVPLAIVRRRQLAAEDEEEPPPPKSRRRKNRRRT